MRTVAGWWDVVSARLYRGYAFGLPWGDWPQRLLTWLRCGPRQFTPVGACGGDFGRRLCFGGSGGGAVGVVATVVFVSLFAFGYGTPDSHVYLVSVLPVAAVLLGEGLAWVVEKGVPVQRWSVLPVALLVWNWQASDVHADREAVDWLPRTLAATPTDAVLVTEGDDGHLFALWYAQAALTERRDVLVIDRNLWWQESYHAFLFAQVGRVVAEPEDFAVGRPLCRIVREGVACP